MSTSGPFHIPKSIMRLPNACAGRAYNGNGSFVSLKNIDTSSVSPDLAQNVELLRHEGKFGVLHASDLSSKQLRFNCYYEHQLATHHYKQALKDRVQAKAAYGLASLAGAAATSFAAVSVSKALDLSAAPVCPQEKTNAVIDERCFSVDYAHEMNGLKVEGSLSAFGAVVLTVAAVRAFRSGHK